MSFATSQRWLLGLDGCQKTNIHKNHIFDATKVLTSSVSCDAFGKQVIHEILPSNNIHYLIVSKSRQSTPSFTLLMGFPNLIVYLVKRAARTFT